MSNPIVEKAAIIAQEYEDLNNQLMDPETLSDPKKVARLAKKQASIKAIVDEYEIYQKYANQKEEGLALLQEDDPDIKEMAKEEIADADANIPAILEKLHILLIPKDPEDDCDAIIEIRGGAGGDEGNIFAGDLYRMYTMYAEKIGWKVQQLEESEGEAGGFALISCLVKGNDVYHHFKYESGTHRVQRVPKTESQGRVHTSTATVWVYPNVEDLNDDEFEIPESDLTFETHRASGAGGQHINKTDSAVRIVHVPTGISVNCQDGRSQIENRETALRLIKARVYEEMKREKEAKEGAERRSKIGTGDRSEKIRTYNYPQNRVTDHRIGLTINQLDRIMDGKLDAVIDGLLQEEQRQKLALEEQ